MTDLSIGRLTLKLSGVSEIDSQRLAQLIAQGLASATISAESSRSIPSLHVSVKASPDNRIDTLSTQIVAEIVRQIGKL